jgi:long-chain acyl-CoA synthetase
LEKNSLIGISSHNRVEWFVADIACSMYGLTTVPIHHHIKDEEREFILNQTELSTVICSGQLVAKFIEAKSKSPNLKHVIDMDNGHVDGAIDFSALMEHGTLHPRPIVPRALSELATIIYTSGSTGAPKGAMFTENLWRTFIRMPYLLAEKHALVNVSKGTVAQICALLLSFLTWIRFARPRL